MGKVFLQSALIGFSVVTIIASGVIIHEEIEHRKFVKKCQDLLDEMERGIKDPTYTGQY